MLKFSFLKKTNVNLSKKFFYKYNKISQYFHKKLNCQVIRDQNIIKEKKNILRLDKTQNKSIIKIH